MANHYYFHRFKLFEWFVSNVFFPFSNSTTGSTAFSVTMDHCNGCWHSDWTRPFHLYDYYGCGKLHANGNRHSDTVEKIYYFSPNFIAAMLRSDYCDDVHHRHFSRMYQCKCSMVSLPTQSIHNLIVYRFNGLCVFCVYF